VISQRVLCRTLVGRAAELDHLAAARRAAGGSHGGAVVVTGEPGIGKSRLVREFHARHCTRSPAVVAQCRAFGQNAFEPLAEILARLDGAARAAGVAESREAHVDAILGVFERAAARRLTTIVVEDLHWAQPELVHLLSTLARWSANRRLLLVATCRDADVPRTGPLFSALAELVRESTLIRLEPLAARDVGELANDALAALGAPLPDEALADVRRRSAGNPLFAEELLRHAVDARRTGREPPPHAVPLSLQGVIRERLGRCTERDRAILSAASAFGERFRIDVVADVFGLERDAIVAALGRLIELQLVEPTADPLAYEFRHALARDVVYGDLVPADAHAFHVRIAEAVEALPDREPYVELLAHSFREAGLPARAASYCERAGERSMATFAYEDAVTWFERAAAAYGDSTPDVGRVLWRASVALNRLNEPNRAAPLYARAIAALVASGDVAAAVRTSTYLAATLYNDGRETDALAQFENASALAARSGSVELQQHARIRRLMLCAAKRDVAAASALCEEVGRHPLDPASRDAFEYGVARAQLHALHGELDARRAAMAAVFDCLRLRGDPPNEVRYAHACFANEALALCLLDEARRHAAAGLDLAQRIRSDAAYMEALLVQIDERAGNLRAARARLDAIPAAAELMHDHERIVAAIRVALASGDDALLAASIDLGLLGRAERGGHATMALQLTIVFAAALARLNRPSEALELAHRFTAAIAAPYPLFWEIVEAARLVPSSVSALRALVAGDPTAATPPGGATLCMLDAIAGADGEPARISCAREAARRFGALGWPMREALALELADDAASALAIYRRIGAAADVRRLERDVERGAVAVLSPQERALARLVADGKNNREAAEVLCVSLKAVEKYLTSIYRKLGISSRTQLTGFVLSGRDAGSR